MQKMTENELQGFRSEFEMTCAAQDGNGRAWLALWNQYKKMMLCFLRSAKGFTYQELESEALDVFAYKLKLFAREKVKSETAFSMHSWLYCATLNRTNKLIRQRKRDVHLYFEDVSASAKDWDGQQYDKTYTKNTVFSSPEEDPVPLENQLIGSNPEIYNTYNPEKIVVDGLHDSDTDRVKAFYAKLSQFDKDILEARRNGMTLAQVAKKFCCSITTIKNHVQKAKRHADDVFQVCYA